MSSHGQAADGVTVAFTAFPNLYTTEVTEHSETWPALALKLTDHKVGPREGECFSCGIFSGPRNSKTVKIRSLLILDIEQREETINKNTGLVLRPAGPPAPPLATAVEQLRRSGWAGVIYTTHSHTEEAPRYRVVIPLAEPFTFEPEDKAAHAIERIIDSRVVALVAHRLGLEEVLDASKCGAESVFFLPRHDADAAHGAETVPGEPLDWGPFYDAARIEYEADERRIEEARATPREHDLNNPIARFNASVGPDLTEMMLAFGYQQSPRSRVDFRSPFQTTQSYATRTYPDGRWISLSASDAAAGLGLESTAGGARCGDAFDLYRCFKHDNDTAQALAKLATPATEPLSRPRPAPLASAAYYGLAGDIVRAIEPHSEADPAALLIQFMTAFGNCAGRYAYFPVEGDRHYPNINVVIVGETSKARKGTSWSRIRQIMNRIDADWTKNRIFGGLSTGEGLVENVRDPVFKMVKNSDTGEMEQTMVDAGVDDKRLLAMATEFAAGLLMMGREGNSLSLTVRDAWDGIPLQFMTRKSPLRATEAHVSMIGHCTAEELRRNLNQTEMANGFANRLIFIFARRSKALPFGGDEEELRSKLQPLEARLDECLKLARGLPPQVKAEVKESPPTGLSLAFMRDQKMSFEVAWAADGRELWGSIYGPLSEGKPGMIGAVTNRAEAQVLRLALIYTLLDGERFIRRLHLEAALALWAYAQGTAEYIWGKVALGDPVADPILEALAAAGETGLPRNSIRDVFHGHVPAGQIERALNLIRSNGLAQKEQLKTKGRPQEVWKLNARK